jgi:hypothetical protein
VRAALAYGGLRYEDVADKTSGKMTESKLRRIASASQPRGAELHELWVIADTCDIPRSWLVDGQWDDGQGRATVSLPRFGEGSLNDRVELLERYVTALLTLHETEASTSEIPVPREPRQPSRRARESS